MPSIIITCCKKRTTTKPLSESTNKWEKDIYVYSNVWYNHENYLHEANTLKKSSSILITSHQLSGNSSPGDWISHTLWFLDIEITMPSPRATTWHHRALLPAEHVHGLRGPVAAAAAGAAAAACRARPPTAAGGWRTDPGGRCGAWWPTILFKGGLWDFVRKHPKGQENICMYLYVFVFVYVHVHVHVYVYVYIYILSFHLIPKSNS